MAGAVSSLPQATGEARPCGKALSRWETVRVMLMPPVGTALPPAGANIHTPVSPTFLKVDRPARMLPPIHVEYCATEISEAGVSV